jgi:hypothetical protein
VSICPGDDDEDFINNNVDIDLNSELQIVQNRMEINIEVGMLLWEQLLLKRYSNSFTGTSPLLEQVPARNHY